MSGIYPQVLLLIGAVLVFLSAISLAYSMSFGAPWLPTPRRRIRALLRAAAVKPGELVIDAGSGDGRVLTLAAKEFGCRGLGIEINPLLLLLARLRIHLAGVGSRVQVMQEDIFDCDFSRADVVFLFLLQTTNVRLQEKLRAELRPGARVVSYAFTLPDFEAVEIAGADRAHHLYRVPNLDNLNSRDTIKTL